MATILSQYSTTGFYKAPVSKGILGCMFVTCTAIHLPLLAHLRRHLICKFPSCLSLTEFYTILASRITFLDAKDLVCGALLIYYFRIFERRFGSHKFASFLLATCTISTVLELSAAAILSRLNIDIHHGTLPTGPYGLIFPLFVNYFFDIPRVAQTHILGVPVTGKTLTYLLGLQVAFASSATSVSALCGLLAGLLYRWRRLALSHWLVIPRWLSKVTSISLGRILQSSPPEDKLLGATLEIQRQQQLELYEHQMMMRRAREQRFAGFGLGQPVADGWGQRNGVLPDMFQGQNNQFRPNIVQVNEQLLQQLMEMGFEEERARNALRSTNNDLQLATGILLQEQ